MTIRIYNPIKVKTRRQQRILICVNPLLWPGRNSQQSTTVVPSCGALGQLGYSMEWKVRACHFQIAPLCINYQTKREGRLGSSFVEEGGTRGATLNQCIGSFHPVLSSHHKLVYHFNLLRYEVLKFLCFIKLNMRYDQNLE